jgi:hypothetical protein
MKFENTHLSEKDKVEIVKQKQQETQKVLDTTLKPKKGHTLFEVNLMEKTIELATFDELPNVNYEDALKDQFAVKRKITKKSNCIYILALNKKNVIKILHRDYNITF